MRILAAAAGLALMTGSALAQEPATATGTFIDGEGNEIGTAEFTATPGGVLISYEASGLPAGEWVGFHFHETGTCDAATHHESAGAHFNPTDAEHGYLAENGPHAGDMPNQYVAGDGTLRAQVFNPLVTLGEGETDIADRALMIHGGADDYLSQPSGDAGSRLACAVVEAAGQ
ncbi:superoxide dismutase family protein [Aureimonas populi]|uniref:Superoxide dismutase [Cu-Zn] n=1 Tax=Aureimonas populi TaxID=1701758 RepID=A0ABW5CL77_9HYPH|nr:superoxide dismutase family protein [Aureimonas populi]